MSELKDSCRYSIERDIIDQPNINKMIQVSIIKTISECNTNTAQTTAYSSFESEFLNKQISKGSFSNQSKQIDYCISKTQEGIFKESYKLSNSMKNNNDIIEVEVNSEKSQQSNKVQEQINKQKEYGIDIKIKWIFTRLIQMNLIQLTHQELKDIIYENTHLHSMLKEEILQYLLDTDFMNPQSTDEGRVVINMDQYLRKDDQIIVQINQRQSIQIKQHTGDDRVSVMDDSQNQDTKQQMNPQSYVLSNMIQQNEIKMQYLKKRESTDFLNQNSSEKQIINLFLSEEEGGITCNICCLSYVPENFYNLLSCQHQFCKDCTLQYIENCIATSQVLKVRCPDEKCEINFTEETLKQILDQNLFEKYQRFKQLKLINQDPTLKWCNKPGCTFYCKINPNDPKIKCECGHEMCFQCGNNWHEGKTCEEMISEEFQGAISKYVISFCPTCKSKVQKASGCNRILCPICQKYFCWICRSPNISYAHYSHLSILGCPGKQFSNSNPDENPKTSKILLFIPRLIIFIFSIVSFVLMLPLCLFSLSILTPNFFYWFTEEVEIDPIKRKFSISKIIGHTFLFILVGIILFPLCLIPGSCIVLSRIIKHKL